ncbi:MAG: hypothetical protein WB822_16815, partial [Rhodoplanes sp.]
KMPNRILWAADSQRCNHNLCKRPFLPHGSTPFNTLKENPFSAEYFPVHGGEADWNGQTLRDTFLKGI